MTLIETRRVRSWVLGWLVALLLLVWTGSAFGGQASTGEAAFYPCDRCHPVTLGADGTPSPPLPIELEKHEIALEVHDVLGTDDEACLACHDDPSRNPGMLRLPDGELVEITGSVSKVCQTCHSTKYREWEQGIHGKDAPKCTAAGCHDPHTPSWIYIPPLPPFQGTGMQVRVVSEREPFKPYAGPPPFPPVLTPTWLIVVASIGALVVVLLVGYLLQGRVKR